MTNMADKMADIAYQTNLKSALESVAHSAEIGSRFSIIDIKNKYLAKIVSELTTQGYRVELQPQAKFFGFLGQSQAHYETEIIVYWD